MAHPSTTMMNTPGTVTLMTIAMIMSVATRASDHVITAAGHNHLPGVTDQRRIGIAFFIIAVFMIVEIVGGLMSGSLALLADAGHMVSDTAALGSGQLGGDSLRTSTPRPRGFLLATNGRYSRGIREWVRA
jgi:hypothetical protein